jgi:hypothetical protein
LQTQPSGSLIGSIKETQGVHDFCGQHDIVSDIKINYAYERVLSPDRTGWTKLRQQNK